ncbi:uncharacterized protein LOC119580474 [Penaeus monodon]|uniref:uncharacterized protein LOC119580474 n=1 Tax=Penaeus monodon TaxID=6687 RepID=UPI0018A750D4|nr:uncharacterized protein LOC119580474 [Penaeus monodon]
MGGALADLVSLHRLRPADSSISRVLSRASVICGAVMAGRGTKGWRCLVLLCSFQAALAAGLDEEQASQCSVFSPGHDLGGRFPLYVGIFPEEENWKWEMEFKNNESKTFLRFDLQSGNEKLTAQLTSGLYSEIHSSEVKWSEDAFPLREWSYLAVYADGDHVVVAQRQDAGAAAVRLSLDKHASTWFRIASNGNVTLNCMDGHDITSESELLQVSENKTYCLQAAGPPVTLPNCNTPLTVTNATWYRIQELEGNYSVSGLIFVIENCSLRLDTTNTTCQPEQAGDSTISLALMSTLAVVGILLIVFVCYCIVREIITEYSLDSLEL